MSISMYDASVPVFVNALTNMRAWLDKAAAKKPEAELLQARLAPDMNPLINQFQTASDAAKGAAARLAGAEPPSMADNEVSFDDLRARCDKTIAYLKGLEAAAFEGSSTRTIDLKFPNGLAFSFNGLQYLTGFALPNFMFHVTTAYAILRSQGVDLGKADFLAHMLPFMTGAPEEAH